MRKILLLAAVLVACSKTEKPATDTAAVAAAPAMAPAPAALTAAQLVGKWNGMTMGATSDSVTGRWMSESADGLSGKITAEGSKIPCPYTATYDADSTVATSTAPCTDPNPKVPKMNFRAVGRMKDGKLVGTVTNTLGSKPDSVMFRGRWTSTKAP